MKVVSNTGPIIGLAKIGKLSLLQQMAGEVLIPPYVHRELFGKIGSEAEHIQSALATFIRIVDIPPVTPDVEKILADIDESEKQAVVLARGEGHDVLLLLDDRAGREAAARLGISTTGLVGLLLLAKEKGLIAGVGTLIEELRNSGYWISDAVLDTARRLAGE